MQGIHLATINGGRPGLVNREERIISWTPPSVTWLKLNMNDALHGNPGLATAGKVIQNGNGQ